MLIQELLDHINNSEIGRLGFTQDEEAIDLREAYTRLVGYFNLGLIELNKHCLLNRLTTPIDIIKDKEIYTFEDSTKILRVRDSNGIVIPTNNASDINTIQIFNTNNLIVPSIYTGQKLLVDNVYNFKSYTVDDVLNKDKVPIANNFIDSLILFIAYKAYLNRDPDLDGTSTVYYNKFKESLNQNVLLSLSDKDYNIDVDAIDRLCYV